MLKQDVIDELGLALEGLRKPSGAGAWEAIAPLERLARSGLGVSIDLAASAALGATVLVTHPARTAIGLDRLSPRRREVARLILDGASNKDIARRLGISVGTAKDHVHAILTSLGFSSRQTMIAASASAS